MEKGQVPLYKDGPTLPAIITIPNAVATIRGGQRPFVQINALIDTGAGTTCITKKVVDSLDLHSIGSAIFGGAYGHPDERNLYCISFTFHGSGVQISDIQVSEADLHNSPFDMLVGRDVLTHCHFSYDGYTGRVVLDVPSPSSPRHPEAIGKQKQKITNIKATKKKAKNRQRNKIGKQSKSANR